jgi:predicted nucleotidyltransferase
MSRVRRRLARVTVTVPADLVRLADRLARSQALSRSAVLSEALRRHVGVELRSPVLHPVPNPVRSLVRAPVPVRIAAQSGPSAAARVAEPAVAPYPVGASSDLAFATDADLVAELQRRLTEPGRRVSAAEILSVDREALAELCRRHHITRLSLFGSVLRDDFRPDSDVDVMVEFEEGKTPGFDIVEVQDELSVLFGGRRVDLVTRPGLNRRLREPILASAQVMYGAG